MRPRKQKSLPFSQASTHHTKNGSQSAASFEPLDFRFIDLFAGIGGLRIGLEKVGGRCVFSSEIDPYAQKTYAAWFGEVPVGDINEFVDGQNVPEHELLAAGFPCQPFSIAGVSKKKSLGREHGFKDRTQGTLFFQLATLIEIRRPEVLLLENVKNLRSHDRGNTWKNWVTPFLHRSSMHSTMSRSIANAFL